jgi:hypothetical protein
LLVNFFLDNNNYSLNKKSSVRKLSINGRRKVKNINIIGGATFYNPPIKTPVNTPFISNDARNVYKRDLKPKETELNNTKPKDDPTLIMRQEVRTNPN